MIVLDRPEDIDFPALLHAGDAVVCAQGLSEPVALTSRLVQQRREIGGITLFLGPTYSETFKPEHGDAIAFRSWCGTAQNASLAAANVLDIVPTHYSELPRMFAQGVWASDVVLLTLSEHDENGRFNLGLANDYVLDAARRARLVIAEVSDRVPWVFGAELPPDIRPHIVVRTGREPLTLAHHDIDDNGAEARIAEHVSALISDGATIELGVGALPEMLLKALRGHRNLGIHSGVIGDGVVDLMQAGVVTNAAKPVDKGVSVGGLLMGSRRLFDFAQRNPAVRLAPASHTHDILTLRAMPDFVALNGAIEVDLTGQVNGEVLNGKYIGAVGGQVDFVRGGNGSPGGRAILALPSTSRGGSVSRIVPVLHDRVVTTPRSDVDVVVTEFGVAALRGKTLRERAKAVTAIAHPSFREELQRIAHALTGSCR